MTLEAPRIPMILRIAEIPAERCSSQTGERSEEWFELSTSHQALPRAAASLLALAFHLPLPAFPISLLGQHSSSRSLPAMLSCTDYSQAQMGSDKANMEGQRRRVCNYSTDLKCVQRRRADNLHRGFDI